MAYDDYELSVDDSQPDELYDFEYEGSGTHYRITSSAFPVTFNTFSYTAEPVKRSVISRNSEIGKNGLTVTIDRNDSFFSRYIVGSLTYNTKLTLYSLQPDNSYITAWIGVIKTVSRTPSNIQITLNPISTNASRPILHRKFQIQCPHALGGYYCGVNLTPFTKAGVVDSIAGTLITSSTFATEADGWFAGGTITIDAEKKTIIKHVGNEITILDAFFGVVAGDALSVKTGCDHSIGTCESKFSNELNFGGCPWIPTSDDIQTGRSFTF